MTSAAWYFAGLATLPVFVLIMCRFFPNRKVDASCLFCGDIKRFDSPQEAREYGRSHISKCKAHPYTVALKRIEETDEALARIEREAVAIGGNCPPAPHACPACEILFVAREAIAKAEAAS